MARRKSSRRKSKKIEKAIRDITVLTPSHASMSVSYLDIPEQLSKVNRKLFPQGYNIAVQDVQFAFTPASAYDTVVVTVSTAGDNWPVHNAHVKGRALWDQMNNLVLEDNPSVEGKWSDFKVFLDGPHRTASVGGGADILQAIAGSGAYAVGEWNYSDYVLPQHDVNPASGEPLAADTTQAHLVGPDLGTPGSFQSVGLVNAYQESRATVFDDAPNVPVGFGTSFFNLLTDSGSQEPELADIIRAENEDPPYDLDNYPGGAAQGVLVLSGFDTANSFAPNGRIDGFLAQCGLVRVAVNAYLGGEPAAAPIVALKFKIAPGHFKGIAAEKMGQ